jgi:hypothetical protein
MTRPPNTELARRATAGPKDDAGISRPAHGSTAKDPGRVGDRPARVRTGAAARVAATQPHRRHIEALASVLAGTPGGTRTC